MDNSFGFIVRVATKQGDFWLGQRVYMDYNGVLTVKHNLQDTKRYLRVYVVPATSEQYDKALSINEIAKQDNTTQTNCDSLDIGVSNDKIKGN